MYDPKHTSSAPESHAQTALDLALGYIGRDWSPVPVPHRKKRPTPDRWQTLRITADTASRHFNGRPQNVGVLLGEPSGGLVDVDLDAPEALVLARRFLPPAGAVFGRPGKPGSHRLYLAPDLGTEQFADPLNRTMLVELRSTGAQTVFPGSTHESGEPIAWETGDQPREVEPATLAACVRRLAGGALLARHLPEGGRNDAAMALTGWLVRGGWDDAEIVAFVAGVIEAAGGNADEAKRAGTVANTRARLERREAVAGYPALLAMLDDALGTSRGAKVMARASSWLGLERQPADGKGAKDDRGEAPSAPVRRERPGRPLELPEPEPWAEPVDGSALLDDLAAAFRRHVALPEHADTALALWCLFTHAHDAFAVSPRLALTSPEKRCGKTTTLTIVGALTPRPLPTSNITAAALFRAVEAARPTLLIDEADTFLGEADELRGILNSGHTRAAAYVVRVVGDDHEPRLFATWSPVAVASIGRLPATLADRSLDVRLRRRTPEEAVERLRLDRLAAFAPLARRCARWAADHAAELAAADPDTPHGLNDRAADNWRPLLALAAAAGGMWPKLARAAASGLSGEGETADDATLGVALLADVRTVWGDADALPSATLIARLVALEEAPWATLVKGKPLNAHRLSRLLSAFGVSSGTIRSGGAFPKGYRRAPLADAFARYLPPLGGYQSATPPQPKQAAGFGQIENATPPSDVAFSNRQNPRQSAACGGVALSGPRKSVFAERPANDGGRRHDGLDDLDHEEGEL